MKTNLYKALAVASLIGGYALFTAMTEDCYLIWLQTFEQLTGDFANDSQNCHNDHMVPGLIYGYNLCMIDANTTYDAGIDDAGQEYENCLERN